MAAALLQAVGNGDRGQPGIDGIGAVAQQDGKMMNLTRLAALHDQAAVRALAHLDQVMVHGADGQQGWDGRALPVHGAVAQNQQGAAGHDGRFGLCTQAFDGRPQPLVPLSHVPGHIERRGLQMMPGRWTQVAHLQAFDSRQLVVREDRPGRFQQFGGGRRLAQQIRAAAQALAERHDHLFTQRVNGRIGHLSKALFEIMKQRARHVRHGGRGRVIAHGANGLAAILPHGAQNHEQFLARIAKSGHQRLRMIDRGLGAISAGRRAGRKTGALEEAGFLGHDLRQRHQVIIQPLAVGLARHEARHDGGVIFDQTGGGVHRQHFTWAQASFLHDARFIHRHRAYFRRHDDQAIVHNNEARGAQAIAVERTAHDAAIGETERGWPVPRLLQAGVIMIKSALLGADIARLFPRLGRQHHQRVAHITPRLHQEIERIVEHGRIAAVRGDDRRQDLGITPPHIGARQIGLTRLHPGDIALQRVDLAVVTNHAERLRAFPGGEGVGAVALMKNGNGRLEIGVVQIGVEIGQLRGHKEALVDHGQG